MRITQISAFDKDGQEMTYKKYQEGFKEFFIDEFIKYCTDLSKYREGLIDGAKKSAEEIITYTKEDADIFFFEVDNEYAGFVIIGTGPKNCHSECDYYIEEFYITLKYRKKGFGLEFMKNIMRQYPGRWCLRILYENSPAIYFWDKLFKHLKAKEITDEIAPDPAAGDGFFCHAFEIRG